MSWDAEVLIIGGGQAGLACAQALAERGREALILDAGAEPGASWRSRYDSLRLFTPRRLSGLPGLALPGDPEGFPGKDELADYLLRYARHFGLSVRSGTRVGTLKRHGAGFAAVTAAGSVYTARAVIAAGGAFGQPRVPGFASALAPRIAQLHSAAYRRPDQLPPGPVLVAGCGNSGAQIAAELAADRPVLLASRRPVRLLPLTMLGRSTFGWMNTLGLFAAPRNSVVGRAMRRRPDPIFGLELRELIGTGRIRWKPEVTGAEGERVRFADGSEEQPAAVIWATGFRPDLGWIDVEGAADELGLPRHHRGVSPVAGLYFAGLPWQHTRSSALICGAGRDAAYAAEHIAAYLQDHRPI
ncbi:oxidoreductase czcO-like protein [Paenibacillus mucilaginosus 3016]|uniref:Oxidoreductase czcO-like protein n=1 Tax=Paenibacillus mucilaginosus 3016 TaxID=1116391 RepID=H6NE75_9BACL|nr:FAD-dependent oxidoreductase [Paenibacillus mucilaginosus]AFC33851.1 oxidoreductase czcO-like protein [Paenibacillus mucilaginosus 3016]